MSTSTKALSSGSQPTASLILPLKYTLLKQLSDTTYLSEGDGGDEIEQISENPAVHEARMVIKNVSVGFALNLDSKSNQ